jgi:hypothetical protein
MITTEASTLASAFSCRASRSTLSTPVICEETSSLQRLSL